MRARKPILESVRTLGFKLIAINCIVEAVNALGPTEQKIIKVISCDIPKTRRQIVQETRLDQKKVDNALLRLRKNGKILRSKEPIRQRERIFKGRGGISSNLRNYYLYVLSPRKKDEVQISNTIFGAITL